MRNKHYKLKSYRLDDWVIKKLEALKEEKDLSYNLLFIDLINNHKDKLNMKIEASNGTSFNHEEIIKKINKAKPTEPEDKELNPILKKELKRRADKCLKLVDLDLKDNKLN